MITEELRVGNYLTPPESTSSQKYAIVNWITPAGIRFKGFGNEVIVHRCKPIELTEEWMAKFGFEKSYIGDDFFEWFDKEGMFGVAFNHTTNGITCKYPLHIWDASFTGAVCLYVHQLQNLYFALKQTELKTK